jgi:hypothetical protein
MTDSTVAFNTANLDGGGTIDPDLYFSNGALVDWQSSGFNLIGAPGADRELFSDGFEAGHTLLWSSEEL